jgi:hypothetical protein
VEEAKSEGGRAGDGPMKPIDDSKPRDYLVEIEIPDEQQPGGAE